MTHSKMMQRLPLVTLSSRLNRLKAFLSMGGCYYKTLANGKPQNANFAGAFL
jgi:hypothetical protein